ncbi:hypothetical protein SERLA73DRAFT_112697 [Serpula lacrymans var. lacrymans S7.3]|uniref:Pyridoxamine kinase/Phosphomethylpyrimidine kinase domain-containing protein n=2 Tax=Serpula lacrymans var. lacrymans TaxID=341189 RepID=F8Q5D0_SERL3|nr:uncharacterized protein SERLADRAFT_451941 [Serpula lacrymans var. lacrymans S7.9]EGN96401.1 hypothetical protein SERLA73DRAFT_112697 [Serpula lacrymans var. lacrymans S7.3]EGO21941.1 hypothetical protein SERLADRAFT_451941 [Serpula lacrymans var. lacrymans S7.9]
MTLVLLTIAGTDSSGGAGIQADLKTFTAHRCYGASVITAMTAQNTTGVQAVHPSPPEFVAEQIRSVLSDINVDAIKTGMLYDTDNVLSVAKTLKQHYQSQTMIPLVCDPVCVSTSGHVLLHPDAIESMIIEIFPLSQLITPNIPEAKLLLSRSGLPDDITSLEEMLTAAQNLLSLGSRAVLLKGGHIPLTYQDLCRVTAANPRIIWAPDDIYDQNMEILQNGRIPAVDLVIDVLCQCSGEINLFPRPRLQSTNTHGTGCTLSAALTCQLGMGVDLAEATKKATAYTHLAIETAPSIGHGSGPLNHLHSILIRRIPLRSQTNPYPLTRSLIQGTASIWKGYVQHDFVKLLGKGILERGSFLHFIKQDYHYLKYYARAYALLATKSHAYDPISAAMETVVTVVRESSMHVEFCAQWGISQSVLENTPESPATTAYGAFLIDTGLQGDSMKLTMALMACLLGYGEVGLWLKKEACKPNSWVVWDGNPYLKWIEDYSGQDYQSAVRKGLETIETKAAADPPSEGRLEEWRQVWEKCTRLEKGFWDMAMNLS